MAKGVLMTREEYCRFRDQHALDDYHQRWPMLQDKRFQLEVERQHIKTMLKSHILSNGGRNTYENEKKVLDEKYWDVVGEMTLIETDAPVRKERLGIP